MGLTAEEQADKMTIKQLVKEIKDELDIYWREEIEGDSRSRFMVMLEELLNRFD